MAVTRTHLVYRVELWDSSGANIVDLLAEIGDLQIAISTAGVDHSDHFQAMGAGTAHGGTEESYQASEALSS